MKEHSGGTPEVGHISLSSWDEESFAVPIEHFDFATLDKPEDYIVENVMDAWRDGVRGDDLTARIRPMLSALVRRQCATVSAVKIACLISLFLEAENPRMLGHQIQWATGMNVMDGEPITKLAKRYGVSKQAFEQGARRICEKLDLKPSRNMRDEKARANMSKRNYRK